jgi:hypothetical protein
MRETSPECNDREWLTEYLAAQWRDIHFNREQDWKILQSPLVSLLATLAIAVLQQNPGKNIVKSPVTAVAALATLAFSVAGLLISARHAKLLQVRIKVIQCVEQLLGLEPLNIIFKESASRIHVQDIIAALYTLIAVLAAILLVASLKPHTTLYMYVLASCPVLVTSAILFREVRETKKRVRGIDCNIIIRKIREKQANYYI